MLSTVPVYSHTYLNTLMLLRDGSRGGYNGGSRRRRGRGRHLLLLLLLVGGGPGGEPSPARDRCWLGGGRSRRRDQGVGDRLGEA